MYKFFCKNVIFIFRIPKVNLKSSALSNFCIYLNCSQRQSIITQVS